MSGDPRMKKRETNAFRRELIAMIRERCGARRCWWTWPLGHEFERGSRYGRSRTCEHCGVPYAFGSFGVYDLIRFLEDKLDAPNEVTEPLFDRWRAAGAEI